MSNLTAYTPVPENSQATPGLWDSRFNVAHANISAVDTTLSQLSTYVSTVSGSGLSGYINVVARGAVGDGTTNDQPAFVSANSSTATQAVLYTPSVASVYRLATSVTISGTYQPIRGAVLRPASGMTVFQKGGVLAGSYQVWDNTAGGSVDFTGNKEMHYYDPRWFGVVGDNVTDDTAAVNFMFQSVPNRCLIMCPDDLKMKITSTITISNKNGINLRGKLGFGTPTDTSDTGMQFTWSGTTSPGAPMFMWNRCGEFLWEGVVFDASGAYGGTPGSGAVWMDEVSGTVTGTACHLRRCRVNAPNTDTNFVGFYIAPTTTNNEEFHYFEDVTVQGNPDAVVAFGYPTWNTGITVSVASGSTIATVSGSTNAILSSYSGKRVRIARAGSGTAADNGVGPLDTTIASYISGDRFSLATTAKSSVTSQMFKIGENKGTAYAIGGNFNSKDIGFRRVWALNMGYGFQSHGGSFKIDGFRCEQNETDCAMDGNQAEESEILNWNTESPNQAFVYTATSPAPIRITGRFSGDRQGLGLGMFQFGPSVAAVEVANATMPTPPSSSTTFNSTGACIFDLTQASTLRAEVRQAHSSNAWFHQSGFSQLHAEGQLVVKDWNDFSATDLNIAYREFSQRRHFYHDGVHDFTGSTAALSLRTTGNSLVSSRLTFNEIAVGIYASGASLAIYSGGTIYIFSSSLSTNG